MISQLQSLTPQIVAKIIATGLNPTGRGSDLKLDMLEAVDIIENIGNIYHWAQHVANMLNTVCEKCQVGRDYKVPIIDTLDSNLPLVPSQGQAIPRTT